MVRNARAQVVHTQIDRPEFAKTQKPFRWWFIHMPRANRSHDRQPTHGVQPGADHAAVHTVVGVVANQLATHIHPCRHPVCLDRRDPQPQHLVENNQFFEYLFQTLHELGFKFNIGRNFGVSGHDLSGFLAMPMIFARMPSMTSSAPPPMDASRPSRYMRETLFSHV